VAESASKVESRRHRVRPAPESGDGGGAVGAAAGNAAKATAGDDAEAAPETT
jgi:hypothetical protein